MKTTKLEKKTVVRNFLLPILPIQSLDNGISLTLVNIKRSVQKWNVCCV